MDAKITAARLAFLETLTDLLGEGDFARSTRGSTSRESANESRAKDNQRLEFLGDAVLGLCVTEELEATHPDAEEGELTRMRSALVNAEALARWRREWASVHCLNDGARGARVGTEKYQTNVIADAVEAIIAAVYLAKGLPAARLLTGRVTSLARSEGAELASLDPKSALRQEKVQAHVPALRAIRSWRRRARRTSRRSRSRSSSNEAVLARGLGAV